MRIRSLTGSEHTSAPEAYQSHSRRQQRDRMLILRARFLRPLEITASLILLGTKHGEVL
jgi:hypothetical protein